MTDVPVFAMGPCQEMFGGVYSAIDVFFNIATCLGLSRGSAEDYGSNEVSEYPKKFGYHRYDESKPMYGPPSRK